MATAAYTYKRQQDRHISLTKLTVILANLGLWASLIVGLALVAR
ncbi:hypothetical protein [Caulobacter sp.]